MKIPDGYRLLQLGEVARSGDLFYLSGKFDKWIPVSQVNEIWNPKDFYPIATKISDNPLADAISIIQGASRAIKSDPELKENDKWFEPYMILHGTLYYLWSQFNNGICEEQG
jgi:hypothetical protein